MKKFDKNNFKKLALMGITGGAALASHGAVEASDLNPSELLAYGGCHGRSGCGGLQAYRTAPSQGGYYTTGQPQGSCANSGQPQYQPQGSCGNYGQPQYQTQQPTYQPQGSCAGYSQPQQPTYQAQGGCAHYTQPQYQAPRPTYQAQGSCSGFGQPQYRSQVAQACHNSNGCHGTSQPVQPSSGCASSSAPQGTPNGAPVAPTAPTAPVTPEAPTQGAAISRWETSGYSADASKGATINRTLSESDLLSQLNEQGKASYQRLDAAGKALALKLANQSCKGQNECKGLNSCKNSEHSCAGKGACAGKADSNFKDKNLAVKVASMKMAEKRTNAATPSASPR